MAIEVAALSAHLRRPLTLIAESDLNDPRLVTPREAGGYGLDAQWSDDFHHAVHVALTGETTGYYADFEPLSALAKVCERGLLPRRHVLVVPRPRPRRARSTPTTMPTWRLVVCSQNHDQIGNRAVGDRLTEHARRRPARLRRAADADRAVHADAVQGEEWAASTPFQFFTSHPEPELGRGDRRGPDRGVRADGLGPGRRARPAGPGDVRALEAGLVRAGRRPARPDARGLPAAGRAAPRPPRADRPVLRGGLVRGRRGDPAVHDAARRRCSSW